MDVGFAGTVEFHLAAVIFLTTISDRDIAQISARFRDNPFKLLVVGVINAFGNCDRSIGLNCQ